MLLSCYDYSYCMPAGYYLIGMGLDISKLHAYYCCHKKQAAFTMIVGGVVAFLTAGLCFLKGYNENVPVVKVILNIQIFFSIVFFSH